MSKKFDFTDLRVLEGLGIYGPRNLSRVARKLGMDTEVLRKRLQRMPSHIFFRLRANVYCTYLGLKKAVVFAEAIPGLEDLLFDGLKANRFWIYVARCYGMNEGCVAVYEVPSAHSADLLQFVNALESKKIARNVQLYWSTCFQGVNSKTKWYDKRSKSWVFSWQRWVEEISSEDTQLPRSLIDPVDYPQRGDEIDLFILKEFEKNPRIRLSKIAKLLNVSQQVIEYHYRTHILKRDLLEGFEVLTFHFDMDTSDMFVFVLKFDNFEKCAKFASSLLDKPFIGGIGKILSKNSLIVDIYLPKQEFRRFIDTLSGLIKSGLLMSYQYAILDLRKTGRQTIPYEHFKERSWVYDHNKDLRSLQDLVERNTAIHERSRSALN